MMKRKPRCDYEDDARYAKHCWENITKPEQLEMVKTYTMIRDRLIEACDALEYSSEMELDGPYVHVGSDTLDGVNIRIKPKKLNKGGSEIYSLPDYRHFDNCAWLISAKLECKATNVYRDETQEIIPSYKLRVFISVHRMLLEDMSSNMVSKTDVFKVHAEIGSANPCPAEINFDEDNWAEVNERMKGITTWTNAAEYASKAAAKEVNKYFKLREYFLEHFAKIHQEIEEQYHMLAIRRNKELNKIKEKLEIIYSELEADDG